MIRLSHLLTLSLLALLLAPTLHAQTLELDASASDVVPDVHFSSVAWGDYTGDGALDLVVTGRSASEYAVGLVYRNDGAGRLTLDTDASDVVADVRASSVAWGDYTGDGVLDLVVTGLGASLERFGLVYRNDGSGRLTLDAAASAVVADVYRSSVAWGDYTGDGALDLVVTGIDNISGNPVGAVYRNDGSGGLVLDAFTSAVVADVYDSSVVWGDYTGDGALDLVVTGTDASFNAVGAVYRNDGSGRLTLDAFTSAVVADVTSGSMAWGDYTGDGALDLVVTGETGVDISRESVGLVYRNNRVGGLTLDAAASALIPAMYNSSVAWGDYTGDGALDLVITGVDNSGNTVGSVYRNDGSGGLTLDAAASAVVPDVHYGSVAWGDYTGDGALDLVVTGGDDPGVSNKPVGSVVRSPLPNAPPVADAGPDQTVEAAGPSGAQVAFDGSGSSDPDGDALTYAWTENGAEIATGAAPTVTLALGTHTITLSVDDGKGETDTDQVVVTVEDTTPPAITLNGDAELTLECDTDYVESGATAVDLVDGTVEVTLSGTVDTGTPGEYVVRYNATDAAGNAAEEVTRTVTVEDTVAPVLTVNADPLVLSRPNHKYVTVALADLGLAAADECDGTVEPGQVTIASVSSDEPENGSGDGNTLDDIVIDDCQTVRVRAERQGSGNGRVYTLTLAVADASGNVGTASYEIQVPKGRNRTAVNDGAVYSVDGCPAAAPLADAPVAAKGDEAPASAAMKGDETLASAAIQAEVTFGLAAPFPNPTAGRATVAFSIEDATEVRLAVYDALGREVAVLLEGAVPAGRHELAFDGAELVAGTYLVRLSTATGLAAMHRLTLLR